MAFSSLLAHPVSRTEKKRRKAAKKSRLFWN